MIGLQKLKSLKMEAIEDYYAMVSAEHADGRMQIAKARFAAMSLRQRKDFMLYLQKEWQLNISDEMYKFFHERL